MSEKIRRINKKPLRVSPRVRAIFYVAVIIFIIAAAGFWGYKKYVNLIAQSKLDKINNRPAGASLYAVLCQNNGCFSLDKNGVAYGSSGKMSGNLILMLNDKTDRNLKLGDKFLDPETLAKLTFFKEKLSGGLDIQLASVETDDPNLEDFDFTTDQNWILRVSIRENTYKTLETLKRTLEQIGLSNIPLLEYVDLRITNKVYYKFR